MTENKHFEQGWQIGVDVLGAETVSEVSQAYTSRVMSAIGAVEQLNNDINSYSGTKLGDGQLGGFTAEAWHAGTFNIDAALKGFPSLARTVNSTGHASVDVSTNFGDNYSLKYYATAEGSIMQQAKNVQQAYFEYLGKSKATNPMSFEEYLHKYEYSEDIKELMKSVYNGQGRIIPGDQLEDAINILKREIAKEACKEGENRAALLQGYLETLSKLTDRIKDGNGVESVPLTKEESLVLAKLAKEGAFDAKNYGYGLTDIITSEYVLKQAVEAGVTAGCITMALKLAPELVKLISLYIKKGYINEKAFKELGLKALSAAGRSMLCGSVSSILTVACKTGACGSAAANLSPSAIGLITVLLIDTLHNSYLVACNKMSPQEAAMKLSKELFVIGTGHLVGTALQAITPVLPGLTYMLGSLVGSVLAQFIANGVEKAIISFCIDTGYTFLGLVEQDYTLPKEVLDRMGIHTISIKKIEIKRININRIKINRINIKRIHIDSVNLVILKRGLIGAYKVGYIMNT